MATYKVTDPRTGKSFKLTGANPPNESQLREIFSSSEPKQKSFKDFAGELLTKGREALPEAGQTVGNMVGSGFGIPGAIAGGIAGRGAGEVAKLRYEQNPTLAIKDILAFSNPAVGGMPESTKFGLGDASKVVSSIQNATKQELIGGAVLGGLGAVGKVAKPLGRTILKEGAKLSESALDAVDRLGIGRVKNIAKQGKDYLVNTALPIAKRNVVSAITKGGREAIDYLDEIGFKPDEVEDVLSVAPDNLKKFGKNISGNWTTLSRNLEKTRQVAGKKIGEFEDAARFIGTSFKIPKTFGSLKTELGEKGMGLIDKTGNIVQNAKDHPSSTIKTLLSAYDDLQQTIKGGGTITIPQYKNLLSKFEASIGQDGKFNRLAYRAIKSLRAEAKDAIAPIARARGIEKEGFEKLYKDYSDSIVLKNLGDRVNKVVNEVPEKLPTIIRQLRDNPIAKAKAIKIYGKDLVDNLEAYNAGVELFNPPKGQGITSFLTRKASTGAMTAGEAIKKSPVSYSRLKGSMQKALLGE